MLILCLITDISFDSRKKPAKFSEQTSQLGRRIQCTPCNELECHPRGAVAARCRNLNLLPGMGAVADSEPAISVQIKSKFSPVRHSAATSSSTGAATITVAFRVTDGRDRHGYSEHPGPPASDGTHCCTTFQRPEPGLPVHGPGRTVTESHQPGPAVLARLRAVPPPV